MKRLARFLIVVLMIALVLVGKAAGSAAANNREGAAGSNRLVEQTLQSGGPVAFLTGPAEGEPVEIALAYIEAQRAEWGLTEDDIAEMTVRDLFVTQQNGTTHIYWRQQLEGIEVYNGDIAAHVAADGSIIALHNQFVAGLNEKANKTRPTLTALEAVNLAAAELGLQPRVPFQVIREIGGLAQEAILNDGGISLNDIPVKLIFQPLADGQVRLAWDISIYETNAQNWWSMRLDAANGAVLSKENWVIQEQWGTGAPETGRGEAAGNLNQQPAEPEANPDQYQVYHIPVESAGHAASPPPADGRTTEANPADAVASPYGWHDTNGSPGAESNLSLGNNVDAYQDSAGDNSGSNADRANGGTNRDFLFAVNFNNAPSTYRPAAVTNLFHWNNLMHDVWYHYGFDEPSGNFQVNNYGNGGSQNDSVMAEAQDGGGTNNANFATPVDGQRPRMQMYLWAVDETGPNKDGDFDNGIIAHEYGHGISIRLTGGPGNSNCLNNQEQMGEGWSDWFGLMMTLESGDSSADGRGIGTYVLGQPTDGPGIRTYRYSTDMTINLHTYDAIKTEVAPHGVGSVWATMLWDMSWAFIEVYGFDPDLYTGTGGNNMAMQLVIDGLKLQPCSPGFVDGRNAILLADQNNYGGANQCLIWEVFARRGLGNSATQGNTNNKNDGTQAFDLPSQCQLLVPSPTPVNHSICVGTSAVYDLSLAAGYTSAPVDLSASGQPVGTTATFSPDPVNSVPNTSQLTIGNTAGATPGSYQIAVTGDDGVRTQTKYVYLDVFNTAPAAPALSGPVTGEIGVNASPVAFSWPAVNGAESYEIDIATDPAFTNIAQTASGLTNTSYEAALNSKTAYYWRVRAVNVCGENESATATFQTMDMACTSYTNGGIGAVPDATCPFLCQLGLAAPTPGVANFNLAGVAAGTIVDLNVLSLRGSHTWVSDLNFKLTSPAGTRVTILPRSCGDMNDYNLTLDDEGSALACPLTGGNTQRVGLTRSNPPPFLSQFDGQNSSGTWQLRVSDFVPGDTGDVDGWGLEFCYQQAFAADYSDLAAGYGAAWHEGSGALRLGTAWNPDSGFAEDSDNGDDDGVTRTGGVWTAGSPVGLSVDVDGNGYLACWFDWNNNGLLENPAEKTVAQDVNDGTNQINFNVPAEFDPSTDSILDSRCRLYASEPNNITGTETPNGGAPAGEVEDYRWEFSPTAVTLRGARLGMASNTTWLVGSLVAIMLVSLGVVVSRRWAS